MNIANRLRVLTVALIVLSLCGFIHGKLPANNAGALDKRLGEVPALKDVTTQRAIVAVLSWARISGGIVETASCESGKPETPKHSFVLAGLSVRQALNLILGEDTNYKWTFDGRIINVVPKAGLPEVLEIRLPHFESEPDSIILDVGQKLFKTSEVNHLLSELGISQDDPLQVMFGSGDRRLAKKIVLNQTTVFDALNTAALSYRKAAVWHYTEHRGHCKQSYQLTWPVL